MSALLGSLSAEENVKFDDFPLGHINIHISTYWAVRWRRAARRRSEAKINAQTTRQGAIQAAAARFDTHTRNTGVSFMKTTHTTTHTHTHTHVVFGLFSIFMTGVHTHKSHPYFKRFSPQFEVSSQKICLATSFSPCKIPIADKLRVASQRQQRLLSRTRPFFASAFNLFTTRLLIWTRPIRQVRIRIGSDGLSVRNRVGH